MAFSRARFGILKESKATEEKFLKYLYKRPLKIFFDKAVGKQELRSGGFARGFEGSGRALLRCVILSVAEGSRSIVRKSNKACGVKKLNTTEIKTFKTLRA